MTSLPEPQIINHFPSCISLKMHFEPEEAANQSQKFVPWDLLQNRTTKVKTKVEPKVTLSLTVQFSGEQEFDVPFGKATFGTKRCVLQCQLEGCKLPLEDVALKDTFKLSVATESQNERSSEVQTGLTLGGTVSDKPSGTATGTLGSKKGDKTVEKMTLESFQVHKSGSEDEPKWIFEVKSNQPVLTGLLAKEPLGVLQGGLSSGYTALENWTGIMRLSAFILVRPGDIRITSGNIGLTRDITRNKTALIELAIAKSTIEAQTKGALSKVQWEWKYD